VVSFNLQTLYYFVLIATVTSAVFFLAPSQGWTDWVLAARTGYSDDVVLGSFLISHIGYKFLIGMAFLSLFPDRRLFHKYLKGRTQIKNNSEE
jgi:hypothetical protein